MTKYAPVIYASAAALIEAVEDIDNTVTIQVVPFSENGKQKFLLIQ